MLQIYICGYLRWSQTSEAAPSVNLRSCFGVHQVLVRLEYIRVVHSYDFVCHGVFQMMVTSFYLCSSNQMYLQLAKVYCIISLYTLLYIYKHCHHKQMRISIYYVL